MRQYVRAREVALECIKWKTLPFAGQEEDRGEVDRRFEMSRWYIDELRKIERFRAVSVVFIALVIESTLGRCDAG